jgi:hypothetical protein
MSWGSGSLALKLSNPIHILDKLIVGQWWAYGPVETGGPSNPPLGGVRALAGVEAILALEQHGIDTLRPPTIS